MATCKTCFSKIDERAKKCPYCQSWQSKLRAILYNPAFSLIVFLILMYSISSYFESKLTPKIDFADYKQKITISDSRIEFGENSCGETVAIIGKLTNNTGIIWKAFTYEIKFFDADNKVSDTNQKSMYSFILPANEEVPFKVSMKKEFKTNKYQNYEIRIVSARIKNFFE